MLLTYSMDRLEYFHHLSTYDASLPNLSTFKLSYGFPQNFEIINKFNAFCQEDQG